MKTPVILKPSDKVCAQMIPLYTHTHTIYPSPSLLPPPSSLPPPHPTPPQRQQEPPLQPGSISIIQRSSDHPSPHTHSLTSSHHHITSSHSHHHITHSHHHILTPSQGAQWRHPPLVPARASAESRGPPPAPDALPLLHTLPLLLLPPPGAPLGREGGGEGRWAEAPQALRGVRGVRSQRLHTPPPLHLHLLHIQSHQVGGAMVM